MRLESLTRPDYILCSLSSSDRDSTLRSLALRLQDTGVVSDAEELCRKLQERERLGSTGIGSGVAIPHCKIAGLAEPVVAIGLIEAPGVDFQSLDEKPVRVVFLVLASTESPAEHLRVLAAISHWVREDGHVNSLLDLGESTEVYQALQNGAS